MRPDEILPSASKSLNTRSKDLKGKTSRIFAPVGGGRKGEGLSCKERRDRRDRRQRRERRAVRFGYRLLAIQNALVVDLWLHRAMRRSRQWRKGRQTMEADQIFGASCSRRCTLRVVMKKIISVVVMAGALSHIASAMGPIGDTTHRHFYKDQEWIWQDKANDSKTAARKQPGKHASLGEIWHMPVAFMVPRQPPPGSLLLRQPTLSFVVPRQPPLSFVVPRQPPLAISVSGTLSGGA